MARNLRLALKFIELVDPVLRFAADNGGKPAMGDSAVITDDEPVTGNAFATAAE